MILKTFHTIYERVEQVGGGSVVLLAMELQLLAMELVKTMQFDPSQSLRVTFKVLGGKTWLDTELGLNTRKSLVWQFVLTTKHLMTGALH